MIDKIIVKSLSIMRNNNYMVEFSNEESIIVKDDIVVKYRLVKGKELDYGVIDEIKEDVKYFEAYQFGIRFISASSKSSSQLVAYLKKKEYSKNIIDKVINEFIENKFIDDEAYVNDYVIYLKNQGYGKKVIFLKSIQLGINKEFINNAIEEIDLDDYIEQAYLVAAKQARNYHKLDLKAKELKIKNYLLNRGYEYEIIYLVVKRMSVDEG